MRKILFLLVAFTLAFLADSLAIGRFWNLLAGFGSCAALIAAARVRKPGPADLNFR